ncbi:MAG: hypothetical protein AAGL89_05645 [Pseudomonadota bacterium]
MTAHQLSLESFDSDQPAEAARHPEYERGFAEGRAEAMASVEAGRRDAIAQLAGQLDDVNFGFEEARTQILVSLRGLMTDLADTIVPEVLNETFSQHLIETVLDVAEYHCAEPVIISVSPDNHASIEAALASSQAMFDINADHNLTDDQVTISHQESQQIIDFDALRRSLRTALLGLETMERKSAHE